MKLISARRALLCLLGLAAITLGLGFALGRSGRASASYDLPGFGHEKGQRDAPIVLIEFADFSCPACASFVRETMPRIEQEWINTGRVRLRVIPFDALRSGRVAARAAECAARQDRFWPMHDLLFARQKEWLGVLGRKGQRLKFVEWAASLDIDTAQFQVCLKDDGIDLELLRNTRLARDQGVPGTPAFVLNGQAIVGALPYRDFAAALAAAAKPAGR